MKKLFNLFIFLTTFFTFHVYAQEQGGTIKGKVTELSGENLIGATVYLKGTTKGVITNTDGVFTLERIKPGDYTLVISMQGYKNNEQPIHVDRGGETRVEASLEESFYELNEVVVTTQKKEQTNIEVPISISAITARSLDRLEVSDFDALSQYIPGLQMQLQSPNNPGFVIRGITSDDGDSRVQPRVSVFQDGVSISRSRGAVVELFDMERVEVVKGPQGTLFGRSAQIGAVHLIQNKPTTTFSGELKLGYGNYNQKLATGYINTPIINSVSNRLSFYYNDRDGYIDNASGGTLNGKSTIAVRDIIRWTPGMHTTLDLILNFQHDDYPGTSFKSGTYAPKGGDTDPNTFADLEKGDSLGILRNVGGATLLLNHDLNSEWKLTSISAYRGFYSNERFDADGTAAPALDFSEIAEGKQLSQEVRMNFDNDSKISGFFGASYFYEDGSQKVPFRTNEQSFYSLLTNLFVSSINSSESLTDEQKAALVQAIYVPLVDDEGNPVYSATIPQGLAYLESSIPGISSLVGAPLNEYHKETYTNYGTTHAFEVFADGTYDLTENLSVTAGLRGTYEHLTGAYESASSDNPSYLGYITGLYPNILFYATDEKVSQSKDYYSYVGRLALNYMLGKNNIYASVAKGRRPGVIQISTDLSNAALDTTFLDPEIVWSYEAGIKGVLFNSVLSYNFNGYYYDWNHFQTTVYEGGYPKTIDAGKAHSIGFESELRYYFLNSHNIFVNYGFIDGKFDDKDSDGNEQEYAGNTFRLTPKHSFSAGLDLNQKITKTLWAYVRPNYTYRSKIYFEDDNTETLSQGAYGLVNLNCGVVLKGKVTYSLGFYGKNILDEKYIIDAGNTGNSFGIPTFIGGTRRTWGLQFKVSF